MVPFGFVENAKRKIQRARCKKFKEEGLANMRKQTFSKDPIVPQSSKKEPTAWSKSVELTSQSVEPTASILAALADP